MRKINIIIAILFISAILASQTMAQPKVEIDNPVFTFKAVPDGAHVTHVFKITNSGDTILHITGVRPP
jgi:hypothetical protein